MTLVTFRGWVGRYGQWLILLGGLLAFFAQADKRYEVATLGMAAATIGAWGLLLAADLPGNRWSQRRPFLKIMLVLCFALTLLGAGLAMSGHPA
ncbi:hypothetical protein FBZ87_102519 [Nitrospirillum amazonense]|uniref:Uncharacterized protein n=1 Tax=Nitrospirillum amazonense TaxID=28077 RepID=A0A560K9U9_9PROT|nr:hypothetical protein [Nitrospirillum amazonense]TWB80095.1 hypothetical protein FBZ87_102519 [Nitrospirillum amazonense]